MNGSPEKHRWLSAGSALVAVDVQNDFCPGGALPVPDGDRVVPVLNRLAAAFRRSSLPRFYTRDWHPADHASFKAQGGPWPPHCVCDTPGAAFHRGLNVECGDIIVSKAFEKEPDAYSFFQGTRLAARMREMGIARIVVGGLATDYCVKSTVLDALKEGFDAAVIRDAIAGIDAKPGDSDRALAEMEAAGAVLLDSEALGV